MLPEWQEVNMLHNWIKHLTSLVLFNALLLVLFTHVVKVYGYIFML